MLPVQVEARLVRLDRELDEAVDDLINAEADYHSAKTQYELAMARSRIDFGSQGKFTVQDKQDMALIACEKELWALSVAESSAKAVRAEVAKLRTQADLVRSMGASVRASMEIA